MSKSNDRSKLAAVKLALAEKYLWLAQVAKSHDKRREFSYNAKKYRQQAARLSG